MAIRSFQVGPAKGLRYAAWDGLPNLVIVCGPNGVGKSTLLRQLFQRRSEFQEPGTDVFFLGPHRPWRTAQLSGAAMYQTPYTYRQYLGMDSFPGWQYVTPPGLEYVAGRPRQPETADEAQGLVKYSIVRLAMQRQRLIEETYDREGGQVPRGAVPEIFEPLRELTRFLLPHLEFAKVDFENTQNIRCLFRRRDADASEVIDIDDLSSGEKAIISLFLPFLESQIQQLIRKETEPGTALPTALFDEPDLHLHPTLQVSLLEYVRGIADRGEAQFVFTTHSPTILDAARDDELFLLAPLATVADGNQFVRVTTSGERLEAVRAVTGSTHLVTRCRPIVFIEGERPSAASGVTDQRLVEMLVPEAASWVLVASRGRQEAIAGARRLRDAVEDGLPGISVFALVDADQALADDPDWAIAWPVAMIENLLLDPAAIFTVVEAQRERVGLRTVEDVERALQELARELRDDEVRLRVRGALGDVRVTVQPVDPAATDTLEEELVAAAREQLARMGGSAAVADVVRRSVAYVDQVLADGRELDVFRGKAILSAFYDRYAKTTGLSKPAFIYALAAAVRGSDRLARLVGQPVRRIQRYVPAELVPAARAAVDRLDDEEEAERARETLRRIEAARADWEGGATAAQDLPALREDVVRLARVLRNHGIEDLHAALVSATVELGLGGTTTE